ncbi:MAG: hypothetical protein J5J00_11495 [Deltaproteobacteria bacterium]|nr:hypothetical protein [Deltaproteobacteria bacterium]
MAGSRALWMLCFVLLCGCASTRGARHNHSLHDEPRKLSPVQRQGAELEARPSHFREAAGTLARKSLDAAVAAAVTVAYDELACSQNGGKELDNVLVTAGTVILLETVQKHMERCREKSCRE